MEWKTHGTVMTVNLILFGVHFLTKLSTCLQDRKQMSSLWTRLLPLQLSPIMYCVPCSRLYGTGSLGSEFRTQGLYEKLNKKMKQLIYWNKKI
jgi:hypothetical protein